MCYTITDQLKGSLSVTPIASSGNKTEFAGKNIKILIVAANASSVFGGEAFLPLKYFQILLKRGYQVRLIAHERNRKNLEKYLGDNVQIYFIEDSIYHRAIWQTGKLLPAILRTVLSGTALNVINEIYQARIIRQLVELGVIDVIHQPIPVSPKSPSGLFGFGVPVVIGPMNGGMEYPPGYHEHENKITRLFVYIARQAAILLNLIIPGKQKASTLIVANQRTKAALPVKRHPRIIELVENGVDLEVWSRSTAKRLRRTDECFRLVFMGRLIALKAVDVTLEALQIARATGADITLDIIGDGDERSALELLSSKLDLCSAVRFHGFLPQHECSLILQGADALILNSVRECGGAVVLEAMSLELPVVASDWGGPPDYLDASCGLLVSPVPRKNFSVRLADAILELANDPERCNEMGKAGRAKICSEFDWEKKVDRMVEIYQKSLAAN